MFSSGSMDSGTRPAYHVGMCPKCGSDHLRIRNDEGLERMMIFFTGERKYRCCDCDWVFRAPDRRRNPRPAPNKVRKVANSTFRYPSLNVGAPNDATERRA